MDFFNRCLCPNRWLALLLLFWAATQLPFSNHLSAAPYPPEGFVVSWTQPDGTILKLRVFGDEFYAKTDNGNTAIYSKAEHTEK